MSGARRDDARIRVRSFVIPLVLVVLAANLVLVGVRRDGVGAFEYLTLAAFVSLLLFTAFRLTRRAV